MSSKSDLNYLKHDNELVGGERAKEGGRGWCLLSCDVLEHSRSNLLM